MKKRISIILFICTCFFVAKGQDTIPKIEGAIYSFVPQYLINNGLRVDIDKQIANRHFVQVCPQFYLREKSNDDESSGGMHSFTRLTGAGLNVYHKIFANENFYENPVYFSYGLTYNFYNVNYIENYLGTDVEAEGKINKAGIDIIIGYQTIIKKVVSIDVYTGLGTRISNMTTDTGSNKKFNDSYFDFNYTGNLMLIGIRLGLIL